MGVILPIIALIFILIWAFRVETGINKANESLKRIEAQLADKKKEKK